MANKPLLLRFPAEDGLLNVSQATLRDVAARLRLSEAETVQLALARLRDEVMPGYAPDDGDLSPDVLACLRRTEPQDDYRPTRSLLEGL